MEVTGKVAWLYPQHVTASAALASSNMHDCAMWPAQCSDAVCTSSSLPDEAKHVLLLFVIIGMVYFAAEACCVPKPV